MEMVHLSFIFLQAFSSQHQSLFSFYCIAISITLKVAVSPNTVFIKGSRTIMRIWRENVLSWHENNVLHFLRGFLFRLIFSLILIFFCEIYPRTSGVPGVDSLNVRSHRILRRSRQPIIAFATRSVRVRLILVKCSTHSLAGMLHLFILVGNQRWSLSGCGPVMISFRAVWQTVEASLLSLSEGRLWDMNNWCVEVGAERRGLKAERFSRLLNTQWQRHPLGREKVSMYKKLLCLPALSVEVFIWKSR